MHDTIKRNRQAIREHWDDVRDIRRDQPKGDRPDKFLRPPETAKRFKLETTFPNIRQKDLTTCINNRRTLRQYGDGPLSFEALSYLMYETCRVTDVRKNATFRTIPTAGATNGMETFIYIDDVESLPKGLYLYVQDKHELALIDTSGDVRDRVDDSLYGQWRGAQLVVYFTAVCERSEYRYNIAAHKMLAMEAGHACQNLALAAEVIDGGICPICAYDQTRADRLLNLNGDDMFVTYCAAVGKK